MHKLPSIIKLVNVGEDFIKPFDFVRNPSIMFDSTMSMDQHITCLVIVFNLPSLRDICTMHAFVLLVRQVKPRFILLLLWNKIIYLLACPQSRVTGSRSCSIEQLTYSLTQESMNCLLISSPNLTGWLLSREMSVDSIWVTYKSGRHPEDYTQINIVL